MKKKLLIAFVIVIAMLFNTTAYACDRNQSENQIAQILFGDEASKYQATDEVKILLDAVYLCCEQYGESGATEYNYLSSKIMFGLPLFDDISIRKRELVACSHSSWNDESIEQKVERKKILEKAVNKSFDFGLIKKYYGNNKAKSESMASFLYDVHILSDYIAGDVEDIHIEGETFAGFSGQPSVVISGNKPNFSKQDKKIEESFAEFSGFDSLGRCGKAYACIGIDDISNAGPRDLDSRIKPSGWKQKKYSGVVNSNPPYLYNRCHLIAHMLLGNDTEENLITGTRYFNENGMLPYEEEVAKYIKNTGNHVLYRVTPKYDKDDLLARGVQMEAYSVEDAGEGICFNVFCYNVQPGININYKTGENYLADNISQNYKAIPFARTNANQENPDLLFEIKDNLSVLFSDQKNTKKYKSLMNELDGISKNARQVGSGSSNSQASDYLKYKEYEYQLYDVLKKYVPSLLEKEDYYKNVFK